MSLENAVRSFDMLACVYVPEVSLCILGTSKLEVAFGQCSYIECDSLRRTSYHHPQYILVRYFEALSL